VGMVLGLVRRLTTICRDFALKLLEINQRRLLDLDI
jgi:hypothetical protein